MKIGLHIGRIMPTDGGGFTYATELVSALDRHRGSCQHELVLCHEQGGDYLAAKYPGFPATDLAARKPGVLSARERAFSHFPGIVDRVYRAAFRFPAVPRWDARVYKAEGIQFVIRLVPWQPTTLDIPFGAVLWDLQHRNNPWFPEVSVLGEWEGREANYATLLRRASIIYTGTQQGKDEIVGYYQVPAQRIHVLPFPTPSFAVAAASVPAEPSVARELGLPKDFLFYPAQFWSHKNHVVILEACRLVRERTGWDLGIVFVGSDQGNRDHVLAYARSLGVQDHTALLGFVGTEQLVQLYKSAFCLSYATFCGPDNLPPLEAFALGCPVVASNVPGAKEQLGEAAILVPPENAQAWADAIISLRDDEARSRLIANGRVRAARDSWDGYASSMLATLDDFALVRRAWA